MMDLKTTLSSTELPKVPQEMRVGESTQSTSQQHKKKKSQKGK